MEAIKSFGSLLASFNALLHPTNIPVFRLKDRKVKAWQF
jgi:hypothetical protein